MKNIWVRTGVLGVEIAVAVGECDIEFPFDFDI